MYIIKFVCCFTLGALVLSAKLGKKDGGGDETKPENQDCEFQRTAIEIAACYEAKCIQRYGEMDCSNDCLLGRKTDDEGCEISCECKTKGVLEGDMMVDGGNIKRTEEQYGKRPQSKDASIGLDRWDNIPGPNGTHIVPIRISPYFEKKKRIIKRAKSAILSAIDAFQEHTCIRFQDSTDNQQHLYIFPGRGCYSFVGRTHYLNQPVSIGSGCGTVGIVIHELMHALGFYHEQSRPDRDDHVTILKENILQSAERNFQKRSASEVDSLGSPYDVDSIMHYGGTDFSKNRRPTIIDKNTGNPVMKQREFFSEEDLVQLNKMYGCKPEKKEKKCK